MAGVHQVKVVVDGVTPQIWRRLQVRSDTSLAQLHQVVQVAFGWEDYHLHKFVDSWGDDLAEHRSLGWYAGVDAMIGYVYDFGDYWVHRITVDKTLVPVAGRTYPRCTAGRRAGPLEDSGGPVGYAELVKQIRARRGPRYRELREGWHGMYDPDAFDLAEVNAELAKLASTDTPA